MKPSESSPPKLNPELTPPGKGHAQIPFTVLFDNDLSPMAKVLYATLKAWKFRYRSRRPSIEILTTWCRAHRQTILKARDELIAAKLLTVKTGGAGHADRTEYQLVEPADYGLGNVPVDAGGNGAKSLGNVPVDRALPSRKCTSRSRSTVLRVDSRSSPERAGLVNSDAVRRRTSKNQAVRRPKLEPTPSSSTAPDPDEKIRQLEVRLGRELSVSEKIRFRITGSHDYAAGADAFDPDGMSESGTWAEVLRALGRDERAFTPFELRWIAGQKRYRTRKGNPRTAWSDSETTTLKNIYAQRVWPALARPAEGAA